MYSIVNKYGMNMLWIKKWQMLQHMHQANTECAFATWQHFSVWNDVMAAIFKLWRHTRNRNQTVSFDVHLLKEQYHKISSWYDLKRWSLRLSMKTVTPRRTRRWVPDPKKECRLLTASQMQWGSKHGCVKRKHQEQDADDVKRRIMGWAAGINLSRQLRGLGATIAKSRFWFIGLKTHIFTIQGFYKVAQLHKPHEMV